MKKSDLVTSELFSEPVKKYYMILGRILELGIMKSFNWPRISKMSTGSRVSLPGFSPGFFVCLFCYVLFF